VTSVYVSHDLAVVAQLADQTAVLYAGRLVEHAAPRHLRGARHPYAVGLLKAVPSSAAARSWSASEAATTPGRWPQAVPSPNGVDPSRTNAARNYRRCVTSETFSSLVGVRSPNRPFR